jgi:predicted glycogen debranching enzyme
LRLTVRGCHAVLTLGSADVLSSYVDEERRGYPHCGRVWSPGLFQFDLAAGDDSATLVASTEPWEIINALAPGPAVQAELARRNRLIDQAVKQAHDGVPAELVLAADQFVITPVGRREDAARAMAAGTEARTVIAGYHWFTDWGRDTMISLEGLTLLTGRHDDAAFILRTFAGYVRDGLIPNMFPDGEREGLYHTADATLWFFHAIDRYVYATGDRNLLDGLLPTLEDIIEHHVRGTRFGIGVDSTDGLLRQGAPGYQLTWMDAKVDGWVVTPRRGKAVEINALFYNALRLMENWTRDDPERQASKYRSLADRLQTSFNQRFWNHESGYLYDVIDGESPAADAACRPNQIFSISLPHAVLSQDRWRAVVDIVRARLLTPYGLRSLSPDSPDYRPQYYGDLRARDAAYHQGTVWAWLIGPFADAWRRAAPHQSSEVKSMLNAFARHLSEAGVGSVSEIFDAESPFTPRGCIAQAWSVAELLRVWGTPAR